MRERALRKQLVALLGTIAGYNDKGHSWAGHGAAQVEHFQLEAQASIEGLVDQIGENAFSPELLDALLSCEAASDASGGFREKAQAELLGASR